MQEIYPERESKILEFKSTLPKFSSLIKTCVAFANGAGGRIIIGVTDNREIIGVNDDMQDRIYEEFPNSLYDATKPNLFAQIYEKNLGSKTVLIIEVAPSYKKPVLIKSEGIPKGVYVRVGPNTRSANQEYIEELIKENQRVTFDEESINQSSLILSRILLKEYYNEMPSEKRLLADKFITQNHSHQEKLTTTVSGVLFFYEQPEQYIPEAVILCTRFAGSNGRNIIQTEEVTGPITKQVQVSFQLIKSWLLRDFSLNETLLRGKSLIPELALREAIINAAVHRKYNIPGATKIALYDDRLEIFNPGGFPGLVDINNLGDGTTYLRNPVIARGARKIGLIEKLGSGIRLIFEVCHKAGLKKPEYQEDGDFVKLIFRFEPDITDLQNDTEIIMQLFNMRQELSLSEVMNYLNVSRNTATRKLNALIRQEKIMRIGKGPAVKFVIKST